MRDLWLDNFLCFLMYAIILLVVGSLVFLGYSLLFPSPTFSLYVKNWECTEQHLETYSYVNMIGKVPVTNFATSSVCDNWKRKK